MEIVTYSGGMRGRWGILFAARHVGVKGEVETSILLRVREGSGEWEASQVIVVLATRIANR